MKVNCAPHAGFCWGVRRAVELAQETAAKLAADSSLTPSAPFVYTDGPLIHNEFEVQRLKAAGVENAPDPAALPKGKTLLIRAHGIPPERRVWLESLGLSLVDATCPFVARIHRLAAEAAAKGQAVLILGDANHAEVIGILGAAAGCGCVVESVAEVEALSEAFVGDKIPVLLAQTTQSEALFNEVSSAVLKRWPNARVENTICNATREHQSELLQLTQQSDVVVVVGSPSSANTQRLAQLSSERVHTVVVQRASDIKAEDFKGVEKVGLTAGASTPDRIINDVVAALEAL